MYITKFVKVGNSYGIIIPSYLCKVMDIHVGTKVTVTLTPDKKSIIIKKVK